MQISKQIHPCPQGFYVFIEKMNLFYLCQAMKNKKTGQSNWDMVLGQKRGHRNLSNIVFKQVWMKWGQRIDTWGKKDPEKGEVSAKNLKQELDPLLKGQQGSQKPEWSECRGEWPEGGTKGHVAQEEPGPFLSEMESHWMLGGRAVIASDLLPMF